MTTRTQQVIRIVVWLMVLQLLGAVLMLLMSDILTLSIAPASHQAPTLSVQTGPHPRLEVYVDGVLTSEWQPSDGEVYWVLWGMVERKYVLLA